MGIVPAFSVRSTWEIYVWVAPVDSAPNAHLTEKDVTVEIAIKSCAGAVAARKRVARRVSVRTSVEFVVESSVRGTWWICVLDVMEESVMNVQVES